MRKRFGPLRVSAARSVVGHYTAEGASEFATVTFKLGRLHLDLSCHGLVGERLKLRWWRLRAGRFFTLLDLTRDWGKRGGINNRFLSAVWDRAERFAFPNDLYSYSRYEV